jgi:predicted PurR-regulated permease PerM
VTLYHGLVGKPSEAGPPMRLDVDRTLKILLTVILAVVVGYFAWQIILRVLYPLTLFLMGATVAFILSPLVKRLHQGGIPKPLAILMVYIALLAAVSLLGYTLINPLVNEIDKLTKDLPKRVNDLQPDLSRLDTWLKSHSLPSIDKLRTQATGYLSTWGNIVLNNLTAVVLTSFTFMVNTVLVLVIAFYLLLDGERLKDRLYLLVPDSQLSRVAFVEATVNEVLGGYLRGQLLMGLTIGTMAGVGTGLLGLQYAVLIGVLAGILELVPMLGPWLASMPAVAIALFSPDPWPLTLWVALYFLAIQQVESNVIGPRITGHAVGLHPLGALMALLVGIELDGILGALFAVPVAGILYVLAMAIYYNLTGRPQPEPVRKPPSSVWFGSLTTNLSSKGIWRPPSRSEQESSTEARLTSARLRRLAKGAVPERLANVEQARDVLLRDKLQQRQAAQEKAEANDAADDAGTDSQPDSPDSENAEREEFARRAR